MKGRSIEVVIPLTFLIVAAVHAESPLRHDPFKQPSVEELVVENEAGNKTDSSPPEFLLKGTVMSARPIANIDGEILSVGEEIDGFLLKSIEEGRVILMKNGEEVVITLSEGSAQKRK